MSGRAYWQDLLLTISNMHLLPHRYRIPLLRCAGAKVGTNVLMYGGSTFHGVISLEIDDDVFINQSCHFDTQAPVHINRGARIGDHVRFVTSNHIIGDSSKRAGAGSSAAIEIGEGSWICSGAVILPGVQIGPGCIVGAGAVVTSSTEPDGLYVGVPARRVRDLSHEKNNGID